MSVKLRLLVLAVTILVSLAIVPTASAAVAYRGVQLHSLWSSSSDENMARELDLVRDLGANAVRADIAWSSLQTDGPNGYSDWYVKKLDAFVAGAEARGMKVIASLWSTPCWASSAPETLKQGCAGAWWDRGVTKYMPRNPLDYARSAQWLTARYGTKLAALEVWNEPNHENFLTASDAAAAYAPLVKVTYPLAKAGNPDVPVLAGALSFADRPFLDRLYALGIKGSYDGISVHPYNEWRAPGDMWDNEWKRYTLIPGLRSIRAAQQAVGDNTPVWITEFGWTNCNAGSDRWCVTTEKQASYLRDSFGLIDAEPYVKSAIVYNLRDKGTDRNDPEDNFGLMTRDYTPKPAYAAVRAAWSGDRSATAAPQRTDGSVLKVRVVVQGGTAYVQGRAPARAIVRLRVSRCQGK
ncbi:MAG: cellulase family glycosylhydrolase, partial [Thermoleophilaceae bacterium]|nr:cellulase family glycosylhydrolase [Thermoleophilaceae bacterium]